MMCHEKGREHQFDTVRGRMNAARHCLYCQAISLDWDDVDEDEDERRVSLSSSHYSVDDQLQDVVNWLETTAPDTYAEFVAAFPEWPTRTMGEGHSSWFDTEAMGVNAEWSSWCIDWIESHTAIWWEDGEPWTREDD